MSIATYTGTLADIGLGVLTGKNPVMRIRPREEAFSSSGLISAVPKTITPNPATGAFTVDLVPSGELTGARTGSAGVPYIIEVGRFEETLDGLVFHGVDVWEFTAVAGGGNVGEMKGGSLLAVWIGPPWPPQPVPPGLYIDMTPPNEWGVRS